MQKELEELAFESNDRLKVIPVERLIDLENIIKEFRNTESLNGFQKWIVDKLYDFKIPDKNFSVNSIILVAIGHPFYANVSFQRKDYEKRTFHCLVRPDFKKTGNYLNKFASENGFSVVHADNLPLKRLGVHSGLAEYGRNNITYVDGFGSNFSYDAYFSDMLCEEDTWGGLKTAEICNNCGLCIKRCPTNAIREDRFLIDNQRCLSYFNEVPGEFPTWLPANIHHTLYDCLICQSICPMNESQIGRITENISFDERETDMLLEGIPIDSFPEDLKSKVFALGIDDWYDSIPRNLKILFELQG